MSDVGRCSPGLYAWFGMWTWLLCHTTQLLLNFCRHYYSWNSFLYINLSMYIQNESKTNVFLSWNLLFWWSYIILKHFKQFTLHAYMCRLWTVPDYNPTSLCCSEIPLACCIWWNPVSLPGHKDGPTYSNALPSTTAILSLLHQSERGSHPRDVANHRGLCCFSGLKPTPITVVATGCLVAHTQDHSTDFQIWVFYLYSVWECEGASAHVSCLTSRVTVFSAHIRLNCSLWEQFMTLNIIYFHFKFNGINIINIYVSLVYFGIVQTNRLGL